MSRWWRAYDEAVDDPKLILLGDKAHRTWFNLMCVASLHEGILPDIKIVAVKLRLTPQRAAAALTELVKAGLFDQREDGRFEPHNWNGRQYKTDVTDPTAATRAKNYRDRKRDAHRDAAVTQSVTVTDTREQSTEADTDKTSLRSERASRATRLPDAWTPSEADLAFAVGRGLAIAKIETEALKFRNHWTSKSGKDATKTNWSRTWENWILNVRGAPNHGNGTGNSRASGHDAILAVASRKARELDRNNPMAGSTGAPGFAFGDGADAAGSHGSRGAAEAGRGDRHRVDLDDQRVREGEIIPPDKDAAGIPGRRQFV